MFSCTEKGFNWHWTLDKYLLTLKNMLIGKRHWTNISFHMRQKKVSIGIGYWPNVFLHSNGIGKDISFHWKKFQSALDQINRMSARTLIWSKLIWSESEADCGVPPPPSFNLLPIPELSKCSWTERDNDLLTIWAMAFQHLDIHILDCGQICPSFILFLAPALSKCSWTD